MATLTSKFKDALTRIEPSAADIKNAPLAHNEVRDALADATGLDDWNVKPILIGSYARSVAIRRVKDVDVFCRMYDLDDDVEPVTVLNRFYKALEDTFGSARVTRNARSFKVTFPEYDDLHVDAVPARQKWDGAWEIPTKDGDWQSTNPLKVNELTTEMNKTHSGMYVPTVKLARQARRAINDARPGGFFVEMCLYDAFKNGKVDTASHARGFVTALEAIADYLDAKIGWGKELPDPSRPGHNMFFRATDNQWETARDKFRAAATKARDAYNNDDEHEAANAYRDLLGVNGDGDDVFPEVPKTAARLITPGAHNVPAGDRRFG
jgi:hypothetical protein